jgi:hypothetical protein
MVIRYFLGLMAGAATGGLVGSIAGNLTVWILVGMLGGVGFIGVWHFLETRRDL